VATAAQRGAAVGSGASVDRGALRAGVDDLGALTERELERLPRLDAARLQVGGGRSPVGGAGEEGGSGTPEVVGETHRRAFPGLDAGDAGVEALDREHGRGTESVGPVREVGGGVAAGAVDEVEGAERHRAGPSTLYVGSPLPQRTITARAGSSDGLDSRCTAP